MRHLVAMLVFVAGCGGDPPCSRADLSPLDEQPAYAVVTSEFFTTAVAILNADAELLTESWIDSGTVTPQVVTALSGDVILPTAAEPDVLTLVDRLGTDVVTRLSVPDGTVLGQVLVSLPIVAGATAYRANPHDVLLVDGQMLVSRNEPNFDAAAPELDRGNDLVTVDLDGTLQSRVDLSALDVTQDGVLFHARPSRLVQVGRFVVVGLTRLDRSFMRTGPGAVAIFDPRTALVTAVELPDLSNCGTVAMGSATTVWVLCEGPTFSGADERRGGAGVVELSLDELGDASILRSWRASDHLAAPIPATLLVSLDDDRLVVGSRGEGNAGDELVLIDMAAGSVSILLSSDEPFSLGTAAYDSTSGLLLVPDAAAGVWRLDVSASSVAVRDLIDVSPCRRLPARHVGRLQ